jgi:hypothetical protein
MPNLIRPRRRSGAAMPEAAIYEAPAASVKLGAMIAARRHQCSRLVGMHRILLVRPSF